MCAALLRLYESAPSFEKHVVETQIWDAMLAQRERERELYAAVEERKTILEEISISVWMD